MIQRRTPLPRSTKPIARGQSPKRSGPPRKKNPGRRQSEFTRCYLSRAFVRFTHAAPCAACGSTRGSDAAHTQNDGMGRKAGWETIAPLCSGINGCHAAQHRAGWGAIGMTEEGRRRAAANHRLAWADSLKGVDDEAA